MPAVLRILSLLRINTFLSLINAALLYIPHILKSTLIRDLLKNKKTEDLKEFLIQINPIFLRNIASYSFKQLLLYVKDFLACLLQVSQVAIYRMQAE